MKFTAFALVVAVALFALSACGSSTGDRALSGGGTGLGALGGLLLGAPVQGA